MSNLFLLAHMSEVLNQLIMRVVKDNPRRGTSPQGLRLMPRYHSSILRLKHPKFQELLGRRLTREDPENGYQRTKLSFLQIFLTAPLRHQSWNLDSRCWQHMKGERHMFQELELNAAGAVGIVGNQNDKDG